MTVAFETEGGIARVTLNRPERMNAVDAATDRRLNEIWAEIEADPEVRCVVVTGAGDRAFCAGADMKAAALEGTEKGGLDYWAEHRPDGFGGLSLRTTLDVPVIARVNGVALGGGFEMVLGCDIVVAADTARFGLPEAAVGRLPLDGGMILLPRLIPRTLAMGMLLTAARIDAAEAARYGLVNEVVPAAELDAAVGRWTTNILACAPLSLKAIKQTVRRTGHLTPQEAQGQRLPALVAALVSEDATEGVTAFVEKRAPIWRGR